jgi:crotonobetainyl-CoA:carnitine CoA-transferase CaiB-like acyl-CoA transferase
VSALAGLRVVELVDERTLDTGRMLAELGADVVIVEPPGGSPVRSAPPFERDEPGVERSLRWQAGAISSRSVVLDLADTDDVATFTALVDRADVVLEGRGHALDPLGVGSNALRESRPSLIWVSVTPFGRESARADDPTTDLTLLAGGGVLWNCGYDDHSLPPIRGHGSQAYNIGSWYATIGVLTALAHRDRTGRGQLVDVNLNAACNVTCEQVTYNWLVAGIVMTRQTGRHAAPGPTAPVQVRCADGRYACTGVLPTQPRQFAALDAWLSELGLLDRLPEAVFLELGAARETRVDLADIGSDPEGASILAAARDAISLIASELSAYDFYIASQEHGFPAGAVVSPDEAFEDPHFVARGVQARVASPDDSSTYRVPGPALPMARGLTVPPVRAPTLDEHGVAVRSELQLHHHEEHRHA